VAPEAADTSSRVGSLVKSVGQPDAGDPHVRLEEGAPVALPCEDIQAPPTERGGTRYGLATALLDRALLYNRVSRCHWLMTKVSGSHNGELGSTSLLLTFSSHMALSFFISGRECSR
jgi:hypothetical protein